MFLSKEEKRAPWVIKVSLKKILILIASVSALLIVGYAINVVLNNNEMSRVVYLEIIQIILLFFFACAFAALIYGLIRENKRRYIGYGIAGILLCGVIFFGVAFLVGVFGISQGGSAPVPGVVRDGGVTYDKYDDYSQEQEDITDTRSFMKIKYSAHAKTTEVAETYKKAANSIKSFDGRIDREDINDTYARIVFVVPQSNFKEFKDELGTIVHHKLFTERILSENLLSEKKTIEANTEQAVSTLNDLETQKKVLEAQYSQRVGTLTKKIQQVNTQLSQVRSKLNSEEDENTRVALHSEEAAFITQLNKLKKEKDLENKTYTASHNEILLQIDDAKNTVGNYIQEDSAFMDDIETVEGEIYISKVGFWELARIFSPVHPIILIVFGVMIAWIVLIRFGLMPKIEFI